MDEEEERENFLEQQQNNENKDNAAQIKAERASFEMGKELQGIRGSRTSRRRRIDLASIDKRYWYALALPALFLTIYFSTNLNTWFGSTSDLKVQFAPDQPKEAELRALYLLHKQQQGLLKLWNYYNNATFKTPNSTHVITNASSSNSSNGFSNTTSPPPIPPFNATSNVPSSPDVGSENTAALNPSFLSGAFATELLAQIKLNQVLQQTLLSPYRSGNGSDSEQSGVDSALNYYGDNNNRCKPLSLNPERKTIKWKPRKDRYLVAICLSGQMSNHLICLEKHMFFAALLGRILVLPSSKFDYQYERVLDIQHMTDCLGSNTVITFEEFSNRKKEHLHINRLICYMATPPCFMDEDHVKKFKAVGWTVLKTEVAWPADAHRKGYPSHPHAEEIVKRFSVDDEVIGIGDVFFADVEEKWVMQPGGPLAHHCKTIIRPNHYIVLTAQRFVQTFLGGNFIALHFRRYGFLQFCNSKEESCFFPIPQAASCILRKVQMSNAPVIYLSTDAAASETDLLQSFMVSNGQTIPLVKRPGHDGKIKWDALLYRHHLHSDDQVFAMLDKTICALASVFIGTSGSTFTDDILRLRRDWGTASACDEFLCQGEKPNFQADLH
ncbi:hypothetical protein SUGI_0141550 [Cryptomeria japonica]|uniref:O-fucosyltransferase 14 n=1 Tax=Cryptomeria japonica TaxID=3369 RepID=UPI002408B87D|nr:O-fucosyltransferase 14 [Cryptomeria japonica]GLJ11053.1 hypothetical protein SUGI_0141550 [Cryptomeria japonica]